MYVYLCLQNRQVHRAQYHVRNLAIILEYEVGSCRLDGSCSSSGGETSWKVGVLAVQDRAIL